MLHASLARWIVASPVAIGAVSSLGLATATVRDCVLARQTPPPDGFQTHLVAIDARRTMMVGTSMSTFLEAAVRA